MMAETRVVEPVVRFCAVISRHNSAIQWAIEKLRTRWGDVVLQSQPMPFEAGGFYTDSMGPDLQKVLIAHAGFPAPDGLADWKHQTNELEAQYAGIQDTGIQDTGIQDTGIQDTGIQGTGKRPHDETRPLNLDPGYVTQAKLVLATTKDRDHRIYLRDGMFAEVTLNYVGGEWVFHRWTYPDYRTLAVANFAQACRDRLREHLKSTGGFRVVRH